MTVGETRARAEARALYDDIIRSVCELPDRTSPDDRPDDVTMTVAELQEILERHLPAALVAAEQRGAERMRRRAAKEAWAWVRDKDTEGVVKAIRSLPLADEIPSAQGNHE